MKVAPDPSLRKTRHATYRGYLYLAWKLEEPGNLDLRADAERFREAVEAACRERNISIEHFAAWKSSLHLLCSPPHRHSPASLLEALKERTSRILGGEPWAGGDLLNTVSHWARVSAADFMGYRAYVTHDASRGRGSGARVPE